MIRILRLALAFFAIQIKRRLAYRGDLFIQGLDEILRGLLALALLQIYLTRTTELAGWDRYQLLFILGFSLVPVSLFHVLCGNLYQLSPHYIIQGNLDRVLLRPYPTFLQICCDRLALEDAGGVVLGILIMVSAASQLPMIWDVTNVALLIGLLFSSFVLVVSIFMAFAASGFWFTDRVGMVPPVYNLMELGRWPVGIWPPVLKGLLTFIVPFSFVAFFPAGWLISPDRTWQHPALLTPLVALVALTIALTAWNYGLRRYGSTGS